MKIGIISDTHLDDYSPQTLPDWVLEAFAGVDLILHAGDITSRRVLHELEQIAPVHAVRGNTDQSCNYLPLDLTVPLDGGKAILAHILFKARALGPDVIMVVHGHTHVGEIVEEGGVWFINPGSPRKPRNGGRPSVVVADVVAGKVRAQFKFPRQLADE